MQESQTFQRGGVYCWTPSGLDCHNSGADCENCPIFKSYGFHKNSNGNRCFQPQSNQLLIDRGVYPPKEIYTESPLAKNRSVSALNRLSDEAIEKLRVEIARLIPTLEKATMRHISNALNAVQFLSRSDWEPIHIDHHVKRMRTAGVLYMSEYVISKAGREAVYTIDNLDNLDGMKKKNTRPGRSWSLKY